MSAFECPSCGGAISQKMKYSKLIVCDYCQSSLLIEDDSVRNAGKMSAIIDEPSIIQLHGTYMYRSWGFTPIGRVRYDYGNGWWDEWYVADNSGNCKWVSVDEGDIAIEEPAEIEGPVPNYDDIYIGMELEFTLKNKKERFVVTEINRCKCIGAEGELPFEVVLNETYNFCDLTGPNSTIFTIEYTEDGVECYEGKWVDPFDVEGTR